MARTLKTQRRPVALALAGGGPLGAIYEIGALRALSESLEGIDFNELDLYVGVSAGAFITAGLANGITPAQICRLFIDGDAALVPFDPRRFLKPAWGELGRRAASVPGLLFEGARRYVQSRGGVGLTSTLMSLNRALPAGIFDNEPVGEFLREVFDAHGGSDDFRALRSRLLLVATNLDTGEAIAFGAPGFDDVPISRAIQASSALPGLFPPVEIGGQWYVDGALKKTVHASMALREGAGLVLCINPLVPWDARRARERGGPAQDDLVKGGLPSVMAQTFRAMIHSRMEVGLARYEMEFPDADTVVFEPDRGDGEFFFANMFSYGNRRRLCEHAYLQTRRQLLARHDELAPRLARHGVRIRLDILQDENRTLWQAVGDPEPPRSDRGGSSNPLARTTRHLEQALRRLESRLEPRQNGRLKRRPA